MTKKRPLRAFYQKKLKNVCQTPGQKDDTLELLMCEGEVPLATFALGEYLKAGGYDWSAPDLADVSVQIDCARLTIRLKIEKWSETYHFNVEI